MTISDRERQARQELYNAFIKSGMNPALAMWYSGAGAGYANSGISAPAVSGGRMVAPTAKAPTSYYTADQLRNAGYSPARVQQIVRTPMAPVISSTVTRVPGAVGDPTAAWASWAASHPNAVAGFPNGTSGTSGGGAAVRVAAQRINRQKAAARVNAAPTPMSFPVIPSVSPGYYHVNPDVQMGGVAPIVASSPSVAPTGPNPANVQGSVIVGPGATQDGVTYLNMDAFSALANLASQMAANNMQGPGPAYGQYSAPGVNMQTPAQAVAKAAYNIGSNPYNVGQNTKENYDFLLKLLQEQVAANAPYTGSPV